MRSWNRQCREAGNSRYDTVVVAKSRADYWEALELHEGKPRGFFHRDHRSVDGRLGIITDTYATRDSIVYLGRLDRQRQRFDFGVGAVGLDASYATSGIVQGGGHRRRTEHQENSPRHPIPATA